MRSSKLASLHSMHKMFEACPEVEDAYEEASEGQRIGVQARLRVLRQLLLQLELGFNIQALKAFITSELMQTAIEAAARVAVGCMEVNDGGSSKGVDASATTTSGGTITQEVTVV